MVRGSNLRKTSRPGFTVKVSMQLSKNFSLAELVRSDAAVRLGDPVQFNPPEEVKRNLKALAIHVLQPLRDAIGHPIKITSGFRSQRVNKAIGGSATSDHCIGCAADIQLVIGGKNCNQLLFDTVVKLGLPFKQMIDEFGTDSEPGWIHISFQEGKNRREKLRARKIAGKTVYSKL
jgi:zinc D-Ala-D-Ala carboxypeptidase